MSKAVRAVSVLQDSFSLHLIKELPHFRRGKVLVVQPLDKPGDRLLEIDVVFPEGVVSINEKGLGGHL